MTHQFTIDQDGDGWLIECSCGWSMWCEGEVQALNAFAEHETECGEKKP